MLPALSRVTSGRFDPPLPPQQSAEQPGQGAAVLKNRGLTALIALVACGGAVALIWAVEPLYLHPDRFPLLFVVAAVLIGAVRLPAYGSKVTLSPIPIVAAIYLYGAQGGVITAAASVIGMELGAHQTHGRKRVFNFGVFALSGLCAGLAVTPFGESPGPSPVSLALFGLCSAGVLYLVNFSLLCCAVGIEVGANPLAVWRERFRWVLPQTLLLGQIATGLALAYKEAGIYELLVFVSPVVGMHVAWRQYLARTTQSVEDLRQKNADLLQLAARLQIAKDTLLNTYRGTLEALVGALDARDNEVQGHSYRVSAYSQLLAERLGVQRGTEEFEAIARGALLHDVGKIGIRDAVLRKPGSLDDGEWAEMRLHSEIGFGILRDIDFLRSAAAMVMAHHERYDGGGYPRGLRAAEIPLGARIFSVSDTFDAMTSDRPYRRALPPESAVAEIQRCAGTQFDPVVVKVFLQVWPEIWAIRSEAINMVA